MNKDRRQTISEALALIERAKSLLETARDDEQDYYDNMPESFQGGDKGEKAQAAIDGLESAIGGLDEAEYGCNDVLEA